eukprot:6475998-Amphidinium_carterae.1
MEVNLSDHRTFEPSRAQFSLSFIVLSIEHGYKSGSIARKTRKLLVVVLPQISQVPVRRSIARLAPLRASACHSEVDLTSSRTSQRRSRSLIGCPSHPIAEIAPEVSGVSGRQ